MGPGLLREKLNSLAGLIHLWKCYPESHENLCMFTQNLEKSIDGCFGNASIHSSLLFIKKLFSRSAIFKATHLLNPWDKVEMLKLEKEERGKTRMTCLW